MLHTVKSFPNILQAQCCSIILTPSCPYLFQLLCFCTTPCWTHIISYNCQIKTHQLLLFKAHWCYWNYKMYKDSILDHNKANCSFAIVMYLIKEYIAPHNHIYTYNQNEAMISKFFQVCLCLHLICGDSCLVDLPRVVLIYLTWPLVAPPCLWSHSVSQMQHV